MSILKQAQIDADNENMANNYKMLQKANELQAAKRAGAEEVVGLAAMQAQEAARAAAVPNAYAQNAAMYQATSTPTAAVVIPASAEQGGRGFYATPADAQGLANWDATRQWLANTKRND